MKTSIKLLLIFVGIVGLLALASDMVLWAYFKKGINGDGTAFEFPQSNGNVITREEKMVDLQPFKAVVINTDEVRIMYNEEYRVGNFEKTLEAAKNCIKQVGDTLYVLPSTRKDITVYCQSVQYIRLAKDSLKVDIIALKQPSLEVVAANNCCVEMSALEIDNFTYNGGQQNKIVTRNMGNFDNVNVQLGMYGSVYLQDVTLRNFSIKADSMIGLRLDEIAMLKLVQFKRN